MLLCIYFGSVFIGFGLYVCVCSAACGIFQEIYKFFSKIIQGDIWDMKVKDIKALKILSHMHTVEHDERILGNEGCVGMMNVTELKITISSVHAESRQKEALLHEIIEGINHYLELKLSHPTITQLAEGLNQTLSDNKLWHLDEDN